MKIIRKIRALFRKNQLDAEMSDEMRLHVELQTEQNVKAGMEPVEAHYAALREFGNVAGLQQRAREQGRWILVEQTVQDIGYAFRQLARAPGFTSASVLILALGIGATTAIFSMVNTVILNPVGGSEPDRLVEVGQLVTGLDGEKLGGVSPPVLDGILARPELFSNVSWCDFINLDRTTGDFVSVEFGAYVSPNFFATLRAQPLLGRGFVSEDSVMVSQGLPVKDPPIILSYAWWQSEFGGDRQILGRVIEMTGRHFTVIGVMRPEFQFPHPGIQFWIPASRIEYPLGNVLLPNTHLYARLAPGIGTDRVQASLDALVRQLMIAYPVHSGYGDWWRADQEHQRLSLSFRPLSAALQGAGTGNWIQLRQTLFGLFAAIGFVLLIVCANVANLAFARVEARRHELAVRAAVGAGRGRLMRQLLTENLILALLGGAAGLIVTAWALKVLVRLNSMPRLRPAEIDGPLLGVALAVTAFSGIVFGLVPMWEGGRVRLNALLADGGKNATGGRRRSHYRDALVVGQVTVTIVLLTGAGLMLRSVNRLLQVDPGFDPENLLSVTFGRPSYRVESGDGSAAEKRYHALLVELRGRFAGLPGVTGVGFEQPMYIQPCIVDGHKEPINLLRALVEVGPENIFRVRRIPLLAGRFFSADEATTKGLIVINEAMAHQCWPGEAAVGKKIRVPDAPGETSEVIGVVRNARLRAYTEEVPPTYYQSAQAVWEGYNFFGGGSPQYAIRSEIDPVTLIQAVRHELKSTQSVFTQPRFWVAKQTLIDSTAAQRTYRNYLGLFAGLGLLLSSLGIYGVLSHAVTRRTREIGIRLAIGAEGRQVSAMIVEQGAGLIVSGTVVGLVASTALTRLLQSQLYEVRATDPLVMVAVVLVLAGVASIACWLPARRAARVDPVVALRAE